MADKKFGGMKFPPQINPATGRFLSSDSETSIKEAVYLILMTQKTERFTRPEFGSTILSYPFSEPSSTRIHMMERELKETLLEQEPRIRNVEVKIQRLKSEETMTVRIDYTMEEGGKGYVEIPI